MANLPKKYIYKPKQGFGIPLANWFRSDLKDYVFDNLSKNVCDKHSLFNHNVINNTLNDHFEKNIDSENKLWSLMQFNLWYKNTFNKANNSAAFNPQTIEESFITFKDYSIDNDKSGNMLYLSMHDKVGDDLRSHQYGHDVH